MSTLQWGGRFTRSPDASLITFGSSLEEDLVVAPFDVRCSLAHVTALERGRIIDVERAQALRKALDRVAAEIESGAFIASARESGAEDVHGAIDARVRALCKDGTGEYLHAGRSRNDQVATTLALYARDRADEGAEASRAIVRELVLRAREELAAGTLLAATTHWQPAQPVLLAFWLAAAAEPFVRAARRFVGIQAEASRVCPLGSGAVAGSTLPLERAASALELGFDGPSRNAMDAIGTRDVALDAAHAFTRAVVDASRIASELVVWCTPALAYARLGDTASTGSSLMPQKRNPDPFELVRATAAELVGGYAGALATLCGLPLSYHRDLQQTKRLAITTIERGLAALRAFSLALSDLSFDRERMSARAGEGYTIATDVADALIAQGVSARRAHELVGAAVTRAEAAQRPLQASDLEALAREAGIAKLDAPLDPAASVRAKRTAGSTNPGEVEKMLDEIEEEVRSFDGVHPERAEPSRRAQDDKSGGELRSG